MRLLMPVYVTSVSPKTMMLVGSVLLTLIEDRLAAEVPLWTKRHHAVTASVGSTSRQEIQLRRNSAVLRELTS